MKTALKTMNLTHAWGSLWITSFNFHLKRNKKQKNHSKLISLSVGCGYIPIWAELRSTRCSTRSGNLIWCSLALASYATDLCHNSMIWSYLVHLPCSSHFESQGRCESLPCLCNSLSLLLHKIRWEMEPSRGIYKRMARHGTILLSIRVEPTGHAFQSCYKDEHSTSHKRDRSSHF